MPFSPYYFIYKYKKRAYFRKVTLRKNAFVHAGIIATGMVFVNVFFSEICVSHQGFIYCFCSLPALADCPYDQ